MDPDARPEWICLQQRGSGLKVVDHGAVRTLLDRTGNSEPSVRPQLSEEIGRLKKRLKLKRLLGALGKAKRRAPAEVARVDVSAMLDEVLHDLVQPSKGCSVKSGEVGFIYRVDLGTGFQQHLDRALTAAGTTPSP